jgi:hypothetical protein
MLSADGGGRIPLWLRVVPELSAWRVTRIVTGCIAGTVSILGCG